MVGRVAAARGLRAGLLALLLLGSSVGAWADSVADGLTLARERQCLGCHQVDARRVGPPFRAIAARFGGEVAAIPLLVRAMREGSIGQWGAIPMPAQTRLSEDEAQRLARWILSLENGHLEP